MHGTLLKSGEQSDTTLAVPHEHPELLALQSDEAQRLNAPPSSGQKLRTVQRVATDYENFNTIEQRFLALMS